MADNLKIAEQTLLDTAGISEKHLQTVLGQLKLSSVDHADLYFQTATQESWGLEDGQVKSGSYHVDCGVGVRAVSGEKTGFAYSDEIVLPALERAAKAARSITQQGQTGQLKVWSKHPVPQRYSATNPLPSLDDKDKVALLEKADQLARKIDPRVKQVFASLAGEHEVVLIVDHTGDMHADVRPLVRLNVTVIAEYQGRREQGSFGGGGRVDYRYFLEAGRLEHYVKEAVRQALLNLEAVPAPAGTMPVVLGPGWPGVLLHEAVGHGLEGDFNRKGVSAFSGRIGERVAAPGVTVVDDGTLPDRRGSLSVDDEGVASQCTTLIEDGILKNYMQDKLNARLMGMAETGNGRRESYAHLPMPRMTNTYMLAGQYDHEEIIASVDKGIYAANFGGGQVDITSGKFVFSASEAYLIEQGKITSPIKGATLVGDGPEVMKRIKMIGNNLKLDEGVGVCGKDGQSVPVGVGQPTLLVDALTVGGTASDTPESKTK